MVLLNSRMPYNTNFSVWVMLIIEDPTVILKLQQQYKLCSFILIYV
jgi:hypothetical protein